MQSPEHQNDNVIPHIRLTQLREAREVIQNEADALLSLLDGLNVSFCDAVDLIHGSSGTLIVTGVGKAGLIGQKIVATMASTGTRAYFLHPTEALHGDLGCVGPQDIVLALSNSGSTEEVLRLLPPLRKLNVPVIAITRDCENPLAKAAAIVLPIGKHKEAGELQLAPSVSTTAMLAMGDALSLVLSRQRGFTEVDFAGFHPAGSLGRKLQPVHEVHHLRGAEYEAREDAAGERRLESVVHCARVDQVHQSIGEHLRVHTQVAAVVQSTEYRVGDRTDAHLQGAAVLDESGDDLADARDLRGLGFGFM